MMDVKTLSSADNPRIKLYGRLSVSSRARKKAGLFIAEGVRLISDAAADDAAVCVDTIFFTDAGFSRCADRMELLQGCCKNIYRVTDNAAKALSNTENSQGVFALLKMPAPVGADTVKHGGRYIILDNIQDPGNIGTMIRTAEACGLDGVIVCGCCDRFSPKAVRAAMGSVMRVPVIECGFEEAAAAVIGAGLPFFAAVVDTCAENIRKTDFSKGGAVVIGNEGSGIPEEHINMIPQRITIPMMGRVNSLNAAMAAGIIMWQLSEG